MKLFGPLTPTSGTAPHTFAKAPEGSTTKINQEGAVRGLHSEFLHPRPTTVDLRPTISITENSITEEKTPVTVQWGPKEKSQARLHL